MKITVIGVVPPCPRCKLIYELAEEAANELGISAAIRKIAYDTDEARQLGKVGTAHHITEWSNMEMDWSKIREIMSEEWTQELDNLLMPCTKKAEEQGWLMTPVLLFDDKVAFMGYVPKKEAIKKAMQEYVSQGG